MAVITISRQYGSGGDQIASRVCQMLGYRYFDKRLIASVAAETGISGEDVVDYSEEQHQVQSFLGRLFNRARPVGEVRVWREDSLGERTAEIEQLDQERAAGFVQLAIEKAYLQGNVVIVGRGGQAILKDKSDVLHVRIESPFEDRVARVQKSQGITQGFAYETVMKKDEVAADYIRQFYGVDWADNSLYHMVVNTSKLSAQAACEVIVEAVCHVSPVLTG